MQFPISSGQAARLLGVPEPRLADLVRRHRVLPPPAVVAGRRQWDRAHLVQAAGALGVPVPPECATPTDPSRGTAP